MDKASILIVEDNHIVMLELKDRLVEMGYKVIDTASTGPEAIAKAEEHLPDLILMDIRLKGEMDGIDAAAVIRKKLKLPFVYLTAHTDEGTLMRAKLTEPYGYIIKPFEERELYSAIETAVYKHKMEKKLIENEHWLSAILTGVGDALVAADTDGIIKLINPAAVKMTGWSEEESLGKKLQDVVKFKDSRLTHRLVNAADIQPEGQTFHKAFLITHEEKEIPVDLTASIITGSRGDCLGIVLVLHDITERIRNKELLVKQNEFIRTIIDTDPGFISVKDSEGRFVLANQSVADALGTDTLEIVGKCESDYFETGSRIDPANDYSEVLNNEGELFIPEQQFIDSAGENHIIQTYKKAIDSFNDEEKLILSVSTDITELKKSEKALRLSEERVKILLEAIPDIVLRFTRDGILFDFHAKESSLIFLRTSDIGKKNIYDILDGQLADKILAHAEKAFISNQIQIFEYDTEISKKVIHSEARILNNSQDEFILIIKDITERKRTQLELKALNASKDKFFSIIAHDLRSSFNSLLGFSSFLADEVSTLHKDEIKKISDSIAESVRSIFGLLENLLQWSRVESGRMICSPEEIELPEVLKKIAVLVKNHLERKNISLTFNTDESLKVMADLNMLETILRNLISNAIKFTHADGAITVTAVRKNNEVEICVEDNGVGMREDTVRKLFNISENISTKGTQQENGSGLGLILCKEFAELNGGALTVKSKVNEGSVFCLRVPGC
ncbi:MAG: PAS domain S-box protein [Syntrophothermus sp.]